MITNINDLDVEGYTSSAGREWVRVRSGAKTRWLLHPLFAGGSQAAISALAEQGIVILSGPQTKALRDRISGLTFGPAPLIEGPGWTEGYFALPDATLFAPPGAEPGVAVFSPDQRRCREQGSLADWKRYVARPLARNPLVSFLIMQAMAAPLLRLVGLTENPGYEIDGPSGKGKSIAQAVMASVIGPATSASAGRYQISLSTTLAGLEDYIAQHADLPMILDEENRVATGHARKARNDLALGLVWQLSGIETTKRFGKVRAATAHMTFTISANDPMSNAFGSGSARYAAATGDRLFPIAVDPEIGVFSPAPSPYAGPGEFADAMMRAIEGQHGTAIRRFLKRLVALNAANSAALRQRILDDMEQFRALMRVSASNGSARRAADAFGIVYAAGRLAREFGAIPRSYDPQWSANQCYSMHVQQQSRSSPEQRLAAFSRREDVLKWTSDLSPISPAESQRYVACVRLNRRGEQELRIPPEVFNSAFPEPELLLNQAAAAGLLQRKVGNRRKKRAITPHAKHEWAYCFVRPKQQQ